MPGVVGAQEGGESCRGRGSLLRRRRRLPSSLPLSLLPLSSLLFLLLPLFFCFLCPAGGRLESPDEPFERSVPRQAGRGGGRGGAEQRGAEDRGSGSHRRRRRHRRSCRSSSLSSCESKEERSRGSPASADLGDLEERRTFIQCLPRPLPLAVVVRRRTRRRGRDNGAQERRRRRQRRRLRRSADHSAPLCSSSSPSQRDHLGAEGSAGPHRGSVDGGGENIPSSRRRIGRNQQRRRDRGQELERRPQLPPGDEVVGLE